VLFALAFLAPVIAPGRPRAAALMSGAVLRHIRCATVAAQSDGPAPLAAVAAV